MKVSRCRPREEEVKDWSQKGHLRSLMELGLGALLLASEAEGEGGEEPSWGSEDRSLLAIGGSR